MSSEQLVPSMEFLAIGAKTKLVASLLSAVETIKSSSDKPEEVTKKDLEKLSEIIKKNTKLNIKLVKDENGYSFAIKLPNMGGNSLGTYKWTGHDVESVRLGSDSANKLMSATVDLNKVEVGGMYSEIPFTMYIPTEELCSKGKLTSEEITAIILHEVGHAFATVTMLGELVWLNYYLQDGVDILLGRKKNEHKLELLGKEYIRQTLNDRPEEELLKSLQDNPNESDARKIILATIANRTRGHMAPTTTMGEFRRSEQLADMFVSRLGLGRALVTGLDKLTSRGPGRFLYKTNAIFFWLLQMGVIIFGIFSLTNPILFKLGYVITIINIVDLIIPDLSNYDDPKERMAKMRRDMVAQIRHPNTTPQLKELMLDDLKQIDKVIDEYRSLPGLTEAVRYFINPYSRRMTQNLKLEETLERLLNNDLFLKAEEFKRLV